MVNRVARSGSVAFCPTSDHVLSNPGQSNQVSQPGVPTRCRALCHIELLLVHHRQCCCNRLLRLETRSFGDWLLNKRWQNIQPAIARDLLSIHVLEMGHFLRGNCRRCSRCLIGLQVSAHISDAVSCIYVGSIHLHCSDHWVPRMCP